MILSSALSTLPAQVEPTPLSHSLSVGGASLAMGVALKVASLVLFLPVGFLSNPCYGLGVGLTLTSFTTECLKESRVHRPSVEQLELKAHRWTKEYYFLLNTMRIGAAVSGLFDTRLSFLLGMAIGIATALAHEWSEIERQQGPAS